MRNTICFNHYQHIPLEGTTSVDVLADGDIRTSSQGCDAWARSERRRLMTALSSMADGGPTDSLPDTASENDVKSPGRTHLTDDCASEMCR